MPLLMVVLMCLVLMYLIAVTLGLHSAVFMVMKLTLFRMYLVVDLISDDADHDSQHKQHCKHDQSLLRNHGQHDECFVTR